MKMERCRYDVWVREEAERGWMRIEDGAQFRESLGFSRATRCRACKGGGDLEAARAMGGSMH